eukprot:COSAG02_NODE_2158_length_9635_cov_32.352139_9_plen_654_part_00
MLLPLSTTFYLRVLAIAPLAYLATALFAAVLAAFAAVGVVRARARPDPRANTEETSAALQKAPHAHDPCVYCPLGLYTLVNIVLLGLVWQFNSRVDNQLQDGLTQAAVGAMSHSSARIWVRAPNHSATCVAATSEDALTTVTGWSRIDSSADHTAIVQLVGLQPSTKYSYTVTACAPGGEELPDRPIMLDSGGFRTFPSPRESIEEAGAHPVSTRFAMGSCTMIGRTVSRTLQGIRRMSETHPDFYLFLGDVIYADVPRIFRGLGGGSAALPMYHSMYRETFANSDFAMLRTTVPGFYQIDDHEILNDFEIDSDTIDVYDTALTAWRTYVGGMNPIAPPVPLSSEMVNTSSNGAELNPLYYSFQAGPHATFFVLDTRSYRQRDTNRTSAKIASKCQRATDPSTTSSEDTHEDMLGKHQGAAVREWLRESQDAGIAFKFLSSPQPWSRNAPPHGKHCSEGWSAHFVERDALLDWIVAAGITGTVFLSGDLHQCGVFELRPGIIEVTASPFDASGQITNHAAGTLDRTIFSQHRYNQAFALITLPVSNAEEPGEQAGHRQLKLEIFQGGTTMVYEFLEATSIVALGLLLLVVIPLLHLSACKDELMSCWRVPTACCLLTPLVVFIAAVVAAPSEDQFAEPRFAALLAETGELVKL